MLIFCSSVTVGSTKTRELLGDPKTGEYTSKNPMNALISTLLQGVKSPGLAVSIAEVVANPEQNGDVYLSIQDLLIPGELKEASSDSLTTVQITYI